MPSSIKKIPILYFHSIGPIIKDWSRNFLTLEAKHFETCLKHFKKNYNVISLKDYYNIRSGVMDSPRKPLVITIDDGFLDNWVWAFPLLKKYDLKATIFISPEMTDPRKIVRPNSDDVMNGKVRNEDLQLTGYMSWEELKIMEASGLVDIQSHTMSHTKFFVSDKIKDFHHEGDDCLYPVGNLFIKEKPFHIANKEFEKLLPYGYPFFEERSSVLAKRVIINPEFINECVSLFNTNEKYDRENAMQKTAEVVKKFKSKENLIIGRETEEEYNSRLNYEIVQSKKIIEENLGKKVEFLSWPHGDNSKGVHEYAIQNGYKATTIGNLNAEDSLDRLGARIGIRTRFNSAKPDLWKMDAKIKDLENNKTINFFKKIYKTLNGLNE